MVGKPDRNGNRATLLMVGSGDPLAKALKSALEQRGLDVGTVDLAGAREAIQLIAPDMILLLGDAAAGGGTAALEAVAGDTRTAGVAVTLLSDGSPAASRPDSFRHGAIAVVPRTDNPQAIAARVARLLDETSEHFEERTGEIGEATFEKLVEMVRKGSRSGILSVHAPGHPGGPIRIVLGAGRSVADAVRELVERVKPHVPAGKSVYYQLHASAGGQVELLDSKAASSGDPRILEGLRVLLVDDDPERANRLAKELRDRNGLVFVTDTGGQGLERAAGLDPQVAIVAAAGLEGKGFEVVRAIRKDARLRWAAILVAPWEELWPDGKAPDLAQLATRVEPLLDTERDFQERSAAAEPFDARLESMGPSRMLRILTQSEGTHHLTITNPKVVVELDVAPQLVVGATAKITGGEEVEGIAALTNLLALGSGRVHVERRDNPAILNVMSPVDEALAAASQDTPTIRSTTIPPSALSVSEPISVPRGPLAPKPKRPFPSLKSMAEPAPEATPETPATVRPPAGIEVPQAAVRTPVPPPVAEGSPVAAGDPRRRPRRKKTLVMGAPVVGAGAPEPTPPPLPPTGPAAAAPEPPRTAPLSVPNLPPHEEATADSPAELDLDESLPLPPPARSVVEPVVPAASETPLAQEPPPPAPPEPPAPEPPAEPPAAALEGLFEEVEPSEPEPAVEPDRGAAPLVSAPGFPADEPVPPPVAAAAPPPARRLGRTIAKAVISLAGLVLLLALGLIGYRASGLRQPQLDALLTQLGSPPAPSEGAEGSVDDSVQDDSVQDDSVQDDSVQDDAAQDDATQDDATQDDATQDDATQDDATQDDATEAGSNDVEELLAQAHRAGESDLAIALYRRALELDPQEHHAMIDLAELLLGRNQPVEATQLLRSAVRRRPRRASYRIQLGDALQASGDAAGARAEWERALELEPDNRQAQRRLGQ